VVGVNYAGDAEANQYFAIAPPTATEVVYELRGGEFVDYLGINGQAVVYDEGSSGVFVAAVESGSPAARLGLEGGDILERLEGLALATDGTMKDYCDVLRTKGDDAEISAQVLRLSSGERLQGTFNSGAELELYESLSDDLAGTATAQGGSASYDDYQYVNDDSGAIEVEVPTEWSGVDGSAYTLEDGSERPRVIATPDLQGFRDNFSTSGVFVVSLPGDLSSDSASLLTQLLDEVGASGACPEATGQEEYDDGLYTGTYELLNGCDGGSASFAGIVASPEGGEFTVFVGVQLVVEADFEALDRIIQSFKVTP
jgi:serine protease Do